MTIELKDGALVCAGTLAVEDAEQLLQLLLERADPQATLAADFSSCLHLHSACLQVLMAAPVQVSRWPEQAGVADWLRAALAQ